VIVGLEGDGTPRSVRVLQTIVLNQLGDYVFAVPAPVRSVLPGPGTESPPGRRENQILWQGFSPGHRVLAARADLRPAESVGSLPLRVRVTTEVAGSPLGPGEKRSGDLHVTLTAENATTAQAKSFTAEPDPGELAVVLGRIRSAIRRDVFAEGLNIRLRSSMTPVAVSVTAPLRLEGTLTFAPGTVQLRGARDGVVRVSSLLDGRRRSLRLVLRGRATNSSAPKLELRVRTAEIPDPVTASQDPRTRLAGTIALELAYARKRQYDMFLASPEQTGPSSTTYVYKTAASLGLATPTAGSGGGEGDHTLGWIVVGLVLVAGVPASAVIWAHS
jgi:hypothetical protein